MLQIGSTWIDSRDNVQNVQFNSKLLSKSRLEKILILIEYWLNYFQSKVQVTKIPELVLISFKGDQLHWVPIVQDPYKVPIRIPTSVLQHERCYLPFQ